MNETGRSALMMGGLISAMCGAVIFITSPLRRRQKELEQLYRKDNEKLKI